MDYINENDLLAKIVISTRTIKNWTQETLAEISKVNIRTIQRLESGKPTSIDTRRLLAKALGYENMDAFNSPTLIQDFSKCKKEVEQLHEETIEKPIEKISSGHQIRELIETYQAFGFYQLQELPHNVEELFAQLQDYVQDYRCIYSDYSATNKLKVNEDFQSIIDELTLMGFSLGTIQGINGKYANNREPLVINSMYFIIGKNNNFPEVKRVMKEPHVDF